MEDVLAVYTQPRDPDCPLVCLDESSKQLLAETRVPKEKLRSVLVYGGFPLSARHVVDGIGAQEFAS